MKKLIAVILVVLSICLIFTSCSITNIELKNRVIVEALGIDKTANGVKVTIQYLNTDLSTNPNNGGAPEKLVKNISLEDESIAAAIKQLTDIMGQRPLLSQNRLVILGRDTVNGSITEYLDYFVRNSFIRATVLFAISDTTAEEIITAKMGEGIIPAKVIEQTLNSQENNAETISQTLYDFVNLLKNKTDSPYLPIIKLKDTDEEDVKEPQVKSTGVFNDKNMACEIKKENSAAILWLNNKYKKGVVKANLDTGEIVTLSIVSSRTKIKVIIKDGNPFYEIKIKCYADCLEASLGYGTDFTKERSKKITQAAQLEIENQIFDTLEISFKDYKVDPFGFGNRLWRSQTDFYSQICDNWNENLPRFGYSVDVDLNLRRIGNEGLIESN